MRNRPAVLADAILAWLHRHDPGWAATRRAGRAAIVAPALFALGIEVFHSSALAYYAAFGCFSMLLFVDFTGPIPQRIRAQVELGVAWALLVCLGTVAARTTWVAAAATVLVAFVVLFSGVVSSVLASTATALLLAFLIPVSSAAPLSQLPDRLAGAGLAAGCSAVAVWVLWPRPSIDPLSAPAARVCRAVAARLRAEAASRNREDAPTGVAGVSDVAEAAVEAAGDLRRAFDKTPYRPTGLSLGSRALVRLVDELTWLSTIADEASPTGSARCGDDQAAASVRRRAADLLDCSADVLAEPRQGLASLRGQIEQLRAEMDALVESSTALLPSVPVTNGEIVDPQVYLSALDVPFRAKELGFVTLQVARNVEVVGRAEQRTWLERLLGREPDSLSGPAMTARERARSHLTSNSVWLHNSLRGAVGLGVAVTLASVTSVQHSFWVLLGSLAVLRSNAMNTGQSAVRAVGGTIVGSIIGAALLQAIGHQTEILWFVLPVAVFLVGIAPAAISFAAGQAAFTVTFVVIFSIGQNPDWHIALLRVQDVALGCAVSLVVALFFWPRGAAAAVDRALAEAYTDGADYFQAAVAYGLSRCGEAQQRLAPPLEDQRGAASSARRLDDVYRSYLTERGVKPVPLADMTTLVTGVVHLRLEADAVQSLWLRAGEARLDPAGAMTRATLLAAADAVAEWYRALGAAIGVGSPVPEPIFRDRSAAGRIVESLQRDLHNGSGEVTANAVRLIWTGDYVASARHLQPALTAAATEVERGA